MKHLLFAAALVAVAPFAEAAIIEMDLIGVAGAGLLPGNEPGTVSGGTGGEIGTGITYNDVTNVLNLSNIGWGSSQGFINLSSSVTAAHIHGPTTNAFGFDGVSNFRQTAGVLFTLNRSSSLVTGGVFTTTSVTITDSQETDLLNGKWYINIHTANNLGGEMRGFFIPVPEPGASALLLGGVLTLARRRRVVNG